MPVYDHLRGPWPLRRGAMALATTSTTSCVIAGQYYKINGVATWICTEGCNKGFELDPTGKLTFVGRSGTWFLFSGSSDLSADKNCTTTYGLYLNGALVPGAETPHTFDAANKVESIGITQLVQLNRGDFVEVFVKSDAANTTVSHFTLSVTFLGQEE